MGLSIDISEAGYGLNSFKLRNIKFSADGERILITGPSGSGKTTLFLTLTGVLTNLLDGYVDGHVYIDGLDPLGEGFNELPRKVGIVLQDPDKQIAMPRVRDELLFTLENLGLDAELRRYYSLLDALGLLHKLDYHVEDLSGGEKRRLTLATALLHSPSLMLMDEPTASMDPWGITYVRKSIEDSISRDVIIIEHKARYFMDIVDRVFLMRGGRIKEVDTRDVATLEENGVDARLVKRISREKTVYRDEVLRTYDVSVGYDQPVLREVDIQVYKGEIVGLIGPNGSGKTTLLKTIAGFQKPLEGLINISRDEVFYIPQEPDLLFLHNTVEKEVLESCRKVGSEPMSYIEVLKIFGISLNKSPYRLSHGQRRILANLLSAIYGRKLILMDEPTTGLDLNAYLALANQVIELSRGGRGVLIATHDPRVVMDLCDRVYLVEDGVVEEVALEEAISYLEKPVSTVS